MSPSISFRAAWTARRPPPARRAEPCLARSNIPRTSILRGVRVLARLSLLLLPLSTAQTQSPELRATWIARDGLTSRAKIVSTLDQLAAANLNCVCVNVWSRGFTIHPSEVLQAAAGVRQDPSYVGRDPLREVLIEAHRRGMEVEAWFEYGFMLGWSGWFAGSSGRGPVLEANPSWLAVDQNGNSSVSDGNGGFFSWGAAEHPEVRALLIDLATEVVDRYDVDGIQFDRVRYPSTAFGYDPTTLAAYRSSTGQNPPSNVNQSTWKRWRADGLRRFHLDVHRAVKARRGTVRVSNAPIIMPLAYDTYLQDWPGWLTDGSVDLVYPQVYRTTFGSYSTTLDQQLALLTAAQRRFIAPGVRAVSGTPTADVVQMVGANQSRNLAGTVLWYAEGLYDDLAALTGGPFAQPRMVPGRPLGWRQIPSVVEETAASNLGGTWSSNLASTASGGTFLRNAAGTAPGRFVEFRALPAAPGSYRVIVSQVTASTHSTAVAHEIEHAGGVMEVRVDQRSAGSVGFAELATVWLDPTIGECVVRVHGQSDGAVAADAIALLPSRRSTSAMTTIGQGSAGSLGVPRISMSGATAIGAEIAIQTSRAAPSAPMFLIVGFQPASVPLFGGTLLVDPALALGTAADTRGIGEWRIEIPFDPSLRGVPLRFQSLSIDTAATGGAALTAATVTAIY